MRKIFPLLMLSIFIFSCSSAPVKEVLQGNDVVLTGTEGTQIPVCRQPDLKDDAAPMYTAAPGDKVKVLKRTPVSALVQLSSGNTGWIDIKHVPK
ncbi:MAG: hypothetical protein LLG37_10060 [Spirochaetia bacterium]|nr:hypothetical protein [Spirochaetia bacterium]